MNNNQPRPQPRPLVTPFNGQRELRETPIIIQYLLDASGSMDPVKKDLTDSFNQDCLGALYGVYKSTKSYIRVGAAVFGDEMTRLWEGYRALHELGENPVSVNQLSGPGLGGNTALYKSVKRCYGQLVNASELVSVKENRFVEAKLMVFTDGANNLEPLDPVEVHRAITWKQDRVKVESTLVYLKTAHGLSKAQFAAAVKGCGFSHGFYFGDHNLDSASLRRALRRLMNLFSDPKHAVQRFAQAGFEDVVLKW